MLMLVLAAAVALQASEGPGPVTRSQVADARKALDESLMDYPTARFRDVRGNAFVLCGFVNSKNRLGAYVGWKRFAWLVGRSDPRLLSDEEQGDRMLLDAFCGEDGLKYQGRDWSGEVTYRP